MKWFYICLSLLFGGFAIVNLFHGDLELTRYFVTLSFLAQILAKEWEGFAELLALIVIYVFLIVLIVTGQRRKK